MATNIMKDLAPDVEIYMVSPYEGVFGSKLGLELQTGNKMTVPSRNGRGSAAEFLLSQFSGHNG